MSVASPLQNDFPDSSRARERLKLLTGVYSYDDPCFVPKADANPLSPRPLPEHKRLCRRVH